MARRILFVHGLEPEVRARDLAYEFERYGRLVRCDIPAPRGGHGSGSLFAFVEFENSRDAEDAYHELHGKRVMGSTLKIQWARRPPSRAWRFDDDKDRDRNRDRDRRRSPRRRSLSPRRRSMSPRRQSASPRRRSVSPAGDRNGAKMNVDEGGRRIRSHSRSASRSRSPPSRPRSNGSPSPVRND